MALQLWLPLIKDKQNKGSSTNFESTTYDDLASSSSGMWGTCYHGRRIYHLTEENLDNQWSLALWVKATDWGVYNDILLCKNAAGSSNTQFYFSVVNGDTLRLVVNGTEFTYAHTFETEVWYHLAATYDGLTYTMYINGDKVQSGAHASAQKTGNLNIGINCRANNDAGTAATGYTATKYINDVRIYDNCLSPREIKEISKGLISHYPLSCPGNPNIEKNTNCGTTGWTRTFGGYYTSTGVEEEWLGVRAYKVGMKLGDTTSTSKWRVVCHRGNTEFANVLKPSTQYTISFDTDRQVWSAASIELTNGQHDLTVSNCTTPTITEYSGYYHYEFVVTTVASDHENWGYNDQYIYLTVKEFIDEYVYIANLKLEEGTKGSDWAPHVDDALYGALGYGIGESDCGLKGNDLLFITPKPTWSSNSPRYTGSHLFNGSSSVAYATNVSYPSIFTVSLWFNPQTVKSDTQYLISLNSGNTGSAGQQFAMFINTTGLSCHAGGQLIAIDYTFQTNTWYHGVLTSDGTKFSFYLNGVLKGSGTAGTVTGTNFTLAGRSNSSAGALSSRMYLYHGLLSDVRIYGTVLSAEDILDLYNYKGSICDSNTVIAGSLNETGNNKLFDINNLIENKTWVTGIGYHGQANCTITLTDDGARIYRPPNITHDSSTMHNMWGGLKIAPLLYDSNIMEQGHRYIILYDVKGQTSNVQATSGWTNNMGWGGGGLQPVPTDVEYSLIPANFQSDDYKTFWYAFTVNDALIKTCTTSYSSFVAGTDYISYRDFQIGWGYTNTGTLGTDIYIRNFRMYDITNTTPVKVCDNGCFKFSAFNEVDNNVKIRACGEMDALDFVEQ